MERWEAHFLSLAAGPLLHEDRSSAWNTVPPASFFFFLSLDSDALSPPEAFFEPSKLLASPQTQLGHCLPSVPAAVRLSLR